MGQRGPLPSLKQHQAEPLQDITPPVWLNKEAAKQWEKHAAHLVANSLLTQATADSYALCCDLWARVRAMSDEPTSRSYLDTVKSYSSLAKLFRMLPCDKPGSPVMSRHDDKPEFKFDG